MARPRRPAPPRRTHDFRWFEVRWLAGYGWTIHRGAAVVVVPLAPDGRVWLCEIERPLAGRSWEVAGGAIDEGEDAVGAGVRELAEECGLVATGRVRELSAAQELAPGMGTFPHRIVVAEGVVPAGRRAVPQKEEGIVRVRRFDRARVRAMIERGAIRVHGTIGGLAASGWLWGDDSRR